MMLVLTYGDNIRLAEIKASRGRFGSGRMRWRAVLLDPASRRQQSETLNSLRDVAQSLERHLLFWFGNSPSHHFLLELLIEAAREKFEKDAMYMRKQAYVF